MSIDVVKLCFCSGHALDRRLINCLAIKASSTSAAQHISSGDTSTLHAVNAVLSNFNTSPASRYTLPVINIFIFKFYKFLIKNALNLRLNVANMGLSSDKIYKFFLKTFTYDHPLNC